MSFFNRVLASVGIGGTKVDTRLAEGRYYAGDEVQGKVFIQGGNVEQRIEEVYLHLLTDYVREHDDHKYNHTQTLDKFRLTGPIQVKPNDQLEVPFAFRLPLYTPSTFDRVQVWVKTSLDIDNAVDPDDHDGLQILPHPYTGVVLKAIEELGFQIRKVENSYAPRYGRGLPFVQEFEFYPGRQYYGKLDELEAVFYPTEDGIEVLLEVDRRARGFVGLLEEAMDADESKVLLRFSQSELERGTGYIASKLDEEIRYHAR
ncbi:sporulation protein [Paenibacillus puldeungensis]|uniref:Sporulation protein n=1 Tax=Paenibacillus puldeungensis TaxID=696536 RepID=A0ABW3RSZ6_9BACL